MIALMGRGHDMAPSKEDGTQIPKGMARALNAEKTRADHHERKRRREEEEQSERGKKRRKADVPEDNLRIMVSRRRHSASSVLTSYDLQPGESMRQFSR